MKWITLYEYSKKYAISLSALKNKIHLNQIEYIFTSGHYKLKDAPVYEQSAFKVNTKPQVFLDNLEEKVKEYALLLNEKNKELQKLKADYDDLKNLVQWLEKDNQQMREIITSVERMEAWLNKSHP